MDPKEIVSLVIQGGFGLIGAFIAFTFNKVSNNFERLEKTVGELNIKLAVVCERVETHESRLERLEEK